MIYGNTGYHTGVADVIRRAAQGLIAEFVIDIGAAL
jgi:hypothetical protein